MYYTLSYKEDGMSGVYTIFCAERTITTEDIRNYVKAELADNFDIKEEIEGRRWAFTIHSRFGYDRNIDLYLTSFYTFNQIK